MMNNLKAMVLLAALTGLLLVAGFLVGQTAGLIVALVFALIMNGAAYWFSDRMALMATGAKEVSPEQAPELHRIVDEVAAQARMPKPRVAIIQSDQPNAFATGRNEKHGVVAVTTGIMRILDERELSAVLGHELGHIRNRDILVSTIAAVIAGAISFIAWMLQWSLIFGGFGGRRNGQAGMLQLLAILAVVILAPIAAVIIRMAISRQREYGADTTGAEITGTPLALASALEKLESYSRAVPMRVNPAMSHMFIVNPLNAAKSDDAGQGWFVGLFSTHPPIPRRIERLQQLARNRNLYA
ncbi:MAG TPA: zinc metalloprotease HtpX [Dehalococcoidia bacterium]|nr:zinc metalloprotease HtpX [Dehalococcoidia bacterium]